MFGAILGDIIGSIYEWADPPIKTKDFELFTKKSTFTDDSVLTLAVAEAIINKWDYKFNVRRFAKKYPNRGYGSQFKKWIYTDPSKPYNSFGNGSAMRVSPIGFAFDTIESVLEEAEKSSIITHDHPEGIKGAQAVALAVFLARTGHSKREIGMEIQKRFHYNLARRIDDIRPGYSFDVTCQGSVPEAILCFLESTDVMDAIRLAISLGGDADTLACITGGIAHAYYKSIPPEIVATARFCLPTELLEIIDIFADVYRIPI
jgi:ADP-ribosylglycohydrolase